LGLLVLRSDQVVFTERENFIVRSLGAIGSDCNKVPDDCRGTGAGSCVPGGTHGSRDCFGEFKVRAALAAGLPPSRVTCVDGDPTCDADAVSGTCTFRVALCLNNEDDRLGCEPDLVTSVRLKGAPAFSAGGQAILGAVGGFGSSSWIARGRGIAFAPAVVERNRCTPYGTFEVRRRKRVGKSKITAVVATQRSGKDASKLQLVCLAP